MSFKDWKKWYLDSVKYIKSDSTLTPLKKHNAILALTGIAPKTESEFLEYQKAILGN